jgi:formylglycine-generating enzyme required for sulfatase activity
MIPGTKATFEMQPIPGGKIKLGSPDAESGHAKSESPQVEIEVEPFWIGAYEVTWAEYKQYMAMTDKFKKLAAAKLMVLKDVDKATIVTAPSNLYDPTFTFQFGEDPKQPALSMSQFAARQYTKWLSGITGDTYRLPSEAEWEHAARAGTTTAYYFGKDAAELKDHAWFMDNAEEMTHKIGLKKPSPWGLFDIYGNVAEWTLDEYTADGYGKLSERRLPKPCNGPPNSSPAPCAAAVGTMTGPAAEVRPGEARTMTTIAAPTRTFPRVPGGSPTATASP